MSISKMAVNKPATILIMFILLAALGIYCTVSLPLDLYPEMDLPYVLVSTTYNNAGPEEVEKTVTRILESALSSVTGLKKLRSTSQSGSSIVSLEFEYGTDIDLCKNDIRDKIEIVRNYLPEDADSPVIFQMDPAMIPIMGIVLTGSRTPEELSHYADDIIQPRLEQIDGVASASMSGFREKAIIVDVPRDRLNAYELTITQICQMVAAQNVSSSGGIIKTEGTNYSVKAEGTYDNVDDIKRTVVSYKTRMNTTGQAEVVSVLLRDVADVYEGYKETTSEAYLNGTPCVALYIQKQTGKNSVATSTKVRNQLKKIREELPDDVELIESYNTTDNIKDTIKQVVRSLIEGIVLAVIVLYIFLRSIKSTFIIALSIPISVLITLALMYFFGFSINMMTLSGLLLGIGMLVDNSIVILENIFSYREKDAKPTVAAVLGSEEMLSAISSSTLTTVCIFIPMILFRKKLGMMGKMFESFAFTIVFSLLCSLFTAAVLVPVLSSKYLVIDKPSAPKKFHWMTTFDRTMNKFFSKMDSGYAKGVSWVLHHKKIVLGSVVGLLAVSVVLIGVIGFTFMPSEVKDSISVNIEMPKGTSLEATREVAQQMEANILPDLKGVKFSTVSVGGSGIGSSAADTNQATIRVTFYSGDEKKHGMDNSETAKNKIRKHFTSFPDADCTFESSGSGGSNSKIDIIIKCDDLDEMRIVAHNIEKVLKDECDDYIHEVTMDLEDGLPELAVNMDRERMYELGVTTYQAGSELNAAINGKTASRYDDNGTQIDIDVSLPEDDKTSFSDLETLYINNSMGKRIPFASFSRYEETLAPVAIHRESQTRTVKISVEPKERVSLSKVQNEIEKAIKENVVLQDNVFISYQGAMEDMMDAVKNFAGIIVMAILLVFAVMASQFQSFKEPFIILFTIPFSFIGVIFIYFISHKMLNVMSIIGMLVLVGSIVNNGIVLVDYTNLLRKRGRPLFEACVEAAQNRLRPILMSTLTTVISLIPMAFFPGENGGLTQPIGLTVLGGMTFGSLMTLFVMPAIYYIFNRKKEAKRVAEEKALLESENDDGKIKIEGLKIEGNTNYDKTETLNLNTEKSDGEIKDNDAKADDEKIKPKRNLRNKKNEKN